MPPAIYNLENTADVDGFSRCVVQLDIRAENGAGMSYGTGILADVGRGEVCLITALHNFTGRNRDGSYKLKSCTIPFKVVVNGPQHPSPVEFPLFSDDAQKQGLFYAHRDGRRVDVAILPVRWSSAYAFQAAHASFFGDQRQATVQLQIGQMCYVIGYPEGVLHRNRALGMLPYWTTGHLASEPRVPFEDRYDYVIDAATNVGLSGAPVFVRGPRGNRLVGIYTGRLLEITGEATQLGLVVGTGTVMETLGQRSLYLDSSG